MLTELAGACDRAVEGHAAEEWNAKRGGQGLGAALCGRKHVNAHGQAIDEELGRTGAQDGKSTLSDVLFGSRPARAGGSRCALIEAELAQRHPQGCHVLDDSQHAEGLLLAKRKLLAHVDERDGLWRRYDQSAVLGRERRREGADQAQVLIRCARRRVDQEHVQSTPADAAEELPHHTVLAWPTQHYRLGLGVEQEADAHHVKVLACLRHTHGLKFLLLRLANSRRSQSKQMRNGRTTYV